MANVVAPYGLRPVKSESGEDRLNYYNLGSASARVYEGDALILSGGYAIKATTNSASTLIGVAAINSGAIVAGGITRFPVYDDPGQVFSIQANSNATQTSVGLAYSLISSSATAGTNLLSIEALDTSVTTTSSPLFMLALEDAPDNASGNQARCLVKINTHALNS